MTSTRTSMAAPARGFESEAAFREWLASHAEDTPELWVLFNHKASGKGGITYSEALDEALCFGWIDGVRRRAGEGQYVQRFSPRRARSTWSAVNLRRFATLRAAGRVDARGVRVFEARDASADGFSIAARPQESASDVEAALRADGAAWAYFAAQPPSYRRLATAWVIDARRETTRERRLATLVADSAAGRRIGLLAAPARRNAEAS